MTGIPCLPEALRALAPDLLRLARHLTGGNDRAQDLCQDVLLNLWIKTSNGAEIEDLHAYARAALRNAYRQSLRRRTPLDELAEDMAVETPRAFGRLALSEVEAAVGRLPEEQARLIRLVAAGETSPAALARVTGWPVGTVMSRLARARARLRTEMDLCAGAPVSELI